MSFFSELFQLASGCDRVEMTVVAKPSEGRLCIAVSPRPGKDADPALRCPLSVEGSPAEFDTDFVQALGSYRIERATLTQQLAAQSAALKQASDEARARATQKAKQSTPAVPARPNSTPTPPAPEPVAPDVERAEEGALPPAPPISEQQGSFAF